MSAKSLRGQSFEKLFDFPELQLVVVADDAGPGTKNDRKRVGQNLIDCT